MAIKKTYWTSFWPAAIRRTCCDQGGVQLTGCRSAAARRDPIEYRARRSVWTPTALRASSDRRDGYSKNQVLLTGASEMSAISPAGSAGTFDPELIADASASSQISTTGSSRCMRAVRRSASPWPSRDSTASRFRGPDPAIDPTRCWTRCQNRQRPGPSISVHPLRVSRCRSGQGPRRRLHAR